MVTLSYRDFRLSVFRAVDLVSTGFQMGLDSGPEWFHLSYIHARLVSPHLSSYPFQFPCLYSSAKSQTLTDKHTFVHVRTHSYTTHRFHLCVLENDNAVIPGLMCKK